jgi:hypothetical protein
MAAALVDLRWINWANDQLLAGHCCWGPLRTSCPDGSHKDEAYI